MKKTKVCGKKVKVTGTGWGHISNSKVIFYLCEDGHETGTSDIKPLDKTRCSHISNWNKTSNMGYA